MTNLQRAALHIANAERGLMGRVTRETYAGKRGATWDAPELSIDLYALRNEPWSSTQAILAQIADALWSTWNTDMLTVKVPESDLFGPRLRAAVERLDDSQWRLVREALAIARTPEHSGAASTCRWCKGPAWPDQDGACRPCRELELQVRTNPEGAREILDAIRRGQ